MTEEMDPKELLEELEQFRKEKERIRMLVGQIGGKHSEKRDHYINIAFIFAMGFLFFFDILRHVLVSIKIIWMIHKGSQVEHFQFWVLNSIEFRLNDVTKRLREIDKKLSTTD